jgi:glycerol-3-phosphate O-acyltransferase
LTELFFGIKHAEPDWLAANNPVPLVGSRIMMDVPHAKLQVADLHAHLCKRTLALCMSFINRKFRQMSRGLYLQQSGFDKVRKLLMAGESVILMPVYRSFADFPVLLYSLLANKIDIPFTIGNQEDLPATQRLVEGVLRKVGYILTKRSRD